MHFIVSAILFLCCVFGGVNAVVSSRSTVGLLPLDCYLLAALQCLLGHLMLDTCALAWAICLHVLRFIVLLGILILVGPHPPIGS